MKTISELYVLIKEQYKDSELKRGMLEALEQLEALSIKEAVKQEIVFNILSSMFLEEGDK